MKPILRTVPGRCYLCRRRVPTERHHIFEGSRRHISEENGFVVDLCPMCHREGPQAVHKNADVARQLKAHCQYVFEQTHSREEWMRLIRKNYL